MVGLGGSGRAGAQYPTSDVKLSDMGHPALSRKILRMGYPVLSRFFRCFPKSGRRIARICEGAAYLWRWGGSIGVTSIS